MNEQRCGAAWTMEDTLELSSNGWTPGLSRPISVESGDVGSTPASSDENVLADKYQAGSNPATASLFTFQPTDDAPACEPLSVLGLPEPRGWFAGSGRPSSPNERSAEAHRIRAAWPRRNGAFNPSIGGSNVRR